MNVSCDSNENISDATITITFPCKQTLMKHDMDRFNLPQFECRIRNRINLLVNSKMLNATGAQTSQGTVVFETLL